MTTTQTIWYFGHYPANAAYPTPVTMEIEVDDWYTACDEFKSMVEAYCDQDAQEAGDAEDRDDMAAEFRSAMADGGPTEGQEYTLTLECHDYRRVTFFIQRDKYDSGPG